MEKIKVLIVEDELLVAADLKAKLEDNNFEVVGVKSSGEEAIKLIAEVIPDLILMDIHLSGKLDGIQAAIELRKKGFDIPLIYLTDHTDKLTVDRAKETRPANYLSKPFKVSDVLRALELAFFDAGQRRSNTLKSRLSDRIFIRLDRQSSIMMPYSEILYIGADRSYSTVVTEDNKFVLSSSMRQVIEQFRHPDFIRVHRGYVINIRQITGIEGNIIKLGKSHQVQMSESYRNEVLGIIQIIK